MVKPLYKWAGKGERTGPSKKRTKEEINVKKNLNKFNFPYSCKRMAKPYPEGPVDQRDSFRVQLCNNFILDIANFYGRLNVSPFSFCAVKLNQTSVVFQWKEYIKHIAYFAQKYESYIGYTVPLLRQKHKRYFNLYSHGVSVL